jgi:hypothetical protein
MTTLWFCYPFSGNMPHVNTFPLRCCFSVGVELGWDVGRSVLSWSHWTADTWSSRRSGRYHDWYAAGSSIYHVIIIPFMTSSLAHLWRHNYHFDSGKCIKNGQSVYCIYLLQASPKDLNDLPEYGEDDRTLDKWGWYFSGWKRMRLILGQWLIEHNR